MHHLTIKIYTTDKKKRPSIAFDINNAFHPSSKYENEKKNRGGGKTHFLMHSHLSLINLYKKHPLLCHVSFTQKCTKQGLKVKAVNLNFFLFFRNYTTQHNINQFQWH